MTALMSVVVVPIGWSREVFTFLLLLSSQCIKSVVISSVFMIMLMPVVLVPMGWALLKFRSVSPESLVSRL
jgi:hypothetical protein